MVNIGREALLVILCVLCQGQFQLLLGLLYPCTTKLHLSTLPWYLSLHSLPVHLLLSFYIDQQFPTQPCWSLTWFLLVGIGSLYTLWKTFLRICCFHPLVPEGSIPVDPIDYILEKLEVCFPKAQEPNFRPFPQACRLHPCTITTAQAVSSPRWPALRWSDPVLNSLWQSSLLPSSRSYLSSMHSRSVLNCPLLSLLLSQQMLVWLVPQQDMNNFDYFIWDLALVCGFFLSNAAW